MTSPTWPTAPRQACRPDRPRPDVLAVDRGLSSPGNANRARQMGGKQVAMPRVGGGPPPGQAVEKGRWFRRACPFRAGAGGGVPTVQRGFGPGRERFYGEARV